MNFAPNLYRSALFLSLLVLALVGRGEPVLPRESALVADRPDITTLKIRPSATDAAIATFDTPHYVYLDHRVAGSRADEHTLPSRGLLLWIPGTQQGESEGPGGASAFCQLAAQLGYRAIILKYPNDESASVCRADSDPAAFEAFRLALIQGSRSAHITIPRTESVEHRLVKLLEHLQRTRPAENWSQFLDGNQPQWSAISVAGQSQGGGHAALLGIKHPVARMICFGAPKDFSLALTAPAAWLRLDSATPKSAFFAFNHDQDRQGCSPAQQAENLRALGLHRYGPPIDVDRTKPPYAHSRILTTNYPGGKVTSREAHTTGISPRNEAVFREVWTYLLTEKTR